MTSIRIKVFCLAALVFVAGCTGNAGKEKDTYKDWRNVSIDSLEQVLATKSLTDKELMKIHGDLSVGYRPVNSEKSVFHSRQGIIYADKVNNQMGKGFLYVELGTSYHDVSKYDSALIYFNKALEQIPLIDKNKVHDIDDLKSRIYGGIANVYNEQDNDHEALKYYLMMLELLEKNHWKNNTMILYHNVGELYFALENYEEAEKYYIKMQALAQELNDTLWIADGLSKTGLIYLYVHKDYQKALENATSALKIMESDPKASLGGKIVPLLLLSETYLDGFQDYANAEKNALLALRYAEKLNFPYDISDALKRLSDVYLRKKMYRESEQTAFKALKMDSTHNIPLFNILAKTEAFLGKPAQAAEYLDRYTALTTERSNKNYQSALKEMEVKYDTEKKELKITALEKEKELMIWLSIAGGGMLLLALVAFFFLWRWTIQKRKLAESKVKQLEQEKQLVATQAVLEGETGERARLARDLHDGLGSILTGVKLNLMELKKSVKLDYSEVERFNKALGLLDESTREMRRVAHHLMPDSLSRLGLKPAVEDFCLNFAPTVIFDYFGDMTRLDPLLEVLVYRSIQELVNNALKYSGASQILVQIIQESDRIAFTVQDDGCGFDPSAATKGSGLQNILNRIASFGGIIQIVSKTGEGTEVNGEIQLTLKNS